MSSPTSPRIAEFTFKAVLCGIAFGVLFGAANAYLGLKSGLTVSTSIPIAVLSAAVFRMLSKDGGTILEANMAQTIGSASSSLASGTIFTIPALFLWGFSPPLVQVALLALCGGVLGILAMVPLRRLLIVQADAELPYPEGRACAEVLRATEKAGSGGRWIMVGLGLGALIKLATSVFHVVPEQIATNLEFLPNASLSMKIAPALLAVGYIVGFRGASVMVSGALISALVLVPLITKIHASGMEAAGASVVMLSASDVAKKYVTFIGAGAIAAAGLFTVFKTAPTMVRSFRAVLTGLKKGRGAVREERTDRDVPAWLLVVGIVTLVCVLAFVPDIFAGELSLKARAAAAIGVAVFGILFVTVSSRLVGLIGVSSNPVSAMALITIASISGVFLAFGWKGTAAMAAVLTVGTVVCVAASKAGDISQDLKTGWLVGGTPALQQFGQLIAASVACWAVAAVVTAIGNGEGFPEGSAPQARLMKTVVEAVLGDALPWDLLLSGAALAGVGILAGLPALPFALGIYLPLSTMMVIFVGGCVRHWIDQRNGAAATEGAGQKKVSGASAAILCASGFVAGEGLAGVLNAGWVYWQKLGRHTPPPQTAVDLALGLLATAVAIYALVLAGRKKL